MKNLSKTPAPITPRVAGDAASYFTELLSLHHSTENEVLSHRREKPELVTDPDTEPQLRPDSGSTPPSHDFNIEDYTREEAEQSKTPIKDSNLQRIDEGTLWQRRVRFNIMAKETRYVFCITNM